MSQLPLIRMGPNTIQPESLSKSLLPRISQGTFFAGELLWLQVYGELTIRAVRSPFDPASTAFALNPRKSRYINQKPDFKKSTHSSRTTTSPTSFLPLAA